MPTTKKVNGWRDGTDPVQRWLRIVTTVVSLGVFVYLAIGQNRGTDDIVVIALAIGAVLVLLGYEGVVRLPFISRKSGDEYDE